MSLRHRSAVLAGGASCLAALAGLVIASTPAASAHPLSAALTAQASAQTQRQIGPRPPLGRAKASGEKAFLGPNDTNTASPWTPLKNPPPFGTPGTMLLESNGTVLVHDEPDNNTTGGTHRVVQAHAGFAGQLHRRDVEQDRVDAGRVHAAVFRVGDPARRAHDRRGRRIHRRKRGVDEPGRDLQPGDQHAGPRSRRRRAGRTSGTRRATCWPTAPSCSSSRARPASRIRSLTVDDALLNATDAEVDGDPRDRARTIPTTKKAGPWSRAASC